MSAMIEAILGNFYLWEAVPTSPSQELTEGCLSICERYGLKRSDDPTWSAFAFAPHLTRRLTLAEYSAPNHGTLIFHPSLLPLRRGPDAIRWAIHDKDAISGATWFFANDSLDGGPICVQEPVLLRSGESAGRAYHTRYVPAALRAFERAVAEYAAARKFSRTPQNEALATYQGRYCRQGDAKCMYCGRPTFPLAYHEGKEDCVAASMPSVGNGARQESAHAGEV